MSSDPYPPAIAAATFCDVACRLGYLSGDDARRVHAESERAGRPPGQTALELGLLDPVQVDAAETLLKPLEAVPGYEILDVLGRGGMGMVYLARQISLGRIVALKTVLISRMHDPAALRRFEQEARVLAQLRHPHVISIYDFGSSSGRLYFAMERVEGSDVAGLLERNGPLDERTALAIARQAAAGLSHAERQGIVHRDIKPANLMLVEPPDGYPLPAGVPMVQIADFGLALLTEQAESCTRLTSDNATVGSPHYMAPEQFQGSRVDVRADIYSLGATVYEMLVDRAPFDGLTLPQIIGRKLSSGPEPLASLRFDLSRGTIALVERMMARDPQQRPQSYAALIAEIDAILPTASAAPSGTFEHSGPRAGQATVIGLHADTRVLRAPETGVSPRLTRGRWRVGIGIGTLLLAAAGVGVWTRWNRDPDPQRVDMVETGPARYLFNGTSMLGWNILSGEWTVPPGESVIVGREGRSSRTLFKDVGGEFAAPDWYRLVLLVQPQDGAAAEVHFGLAAVEGRNGPRYVLQFTSQAASVDQRDNDAAEPSEPLQIVRVGGLAAVTLERLPTGWFITVNDQPLEPLPLRERELPEFRLAATGGAARFSDIELSELAPAAR